MKNASSLHQDCYILSRKKTRWPSSLYPWIVYTRIAVYDLCMAHEIASLYSQYLARAVFVSVSRFSVVFLCFLILLGVWTVLKNLNEFYRSACTLGHYWILKNYLNCGPWTLGNFFFLNVWIGVKYEQMWDWLIDWYFSYEPSILFSRNWLLSTDGSLKET